MAHVCVELIAKKVALDQLQEGHEPGRGAQTSFSGHSGAVPSSSPRIPFADSLAVNWGNCFLNFGPHRLLCLGRTSSPFSSLALIDPKSSSFQYVFITLIVLSPFQFARPQQDPCDLGHQ